MDKKALANVEIKDETKGEVAAVFSTFGVVDHDGDVTDVKAFEDGAKCIISAYNHQSWQGAMPVGKGIIRVGQKEAVMEGQFFMNTTHGRDAFETVKGIAELQEWSYGFDVLESDPAEFEGKSVRMLKKLKVHEVSPVMRGAGVGTHTIGVKKFSEEGDAVLAALASFRARAADVMAMRAQKGKELGDESKALLDQIQAELKEFEELLKVVPQQANHQDELTQAYLRFIQLTSEEGE